MNILNQDIMYLPGVGPNRKKMLSKELGIETYGDLLEYYPYKYVDRSKVYTVHELTGDMPFVQVVGRILSFETFEMGPRKERVVAHFSDGTGIMDLVWFNGGKYAKQTYKIGTKYLVFGRPGVFNNRIQVQHPDIDLADKVELSTMGMQPYYNTTEKMKKSGLNSRAIAKLTKTLVGVLKDPLPETIPDFITAPLHLMSRDQALRNLHYPQDTKDLERARVRLKFEELFFVQLNILRYASDQRRKYRGFVFNRIGPLFNDFYQKNLPFALTGAQKRVMHEIRKDMCTGRQMNRLLQGDVGSGKTITALLVMLIANDNGFQSCLMAPTEILATQHYENISKMLGDMPLGVALLTGSTKTAERREIHEGIQNGTIRILIGTHALIENDVEFQNLGLAVIDEQHRFGVEQRAKLWKKNTPPPHILVMTATPIPRTLAMTVYGDLDVSIIDELPKGRKPIITKHLYERDRNRLFYFLRQQVDAGRQVFVVYPLIQESEKMDLLDLQAGFDAMSRSFPLPRYAVGMVHGKMPNDGKEHEMQRLSKGETNILVSTTVIEVGIDIPNATVMVIENAERFGLSQLHQLRGRVGRGGVQSYCILMSGEKLSSDGKQRLDAMVSTTDGFEIANFDLKLRGPGDLQGTQQSGVLDFKIADIVKDEKLVSYTRELARQILEKDPDLTRPDNKILSEQLQERMKQEKFWGMIS